MSVTGSPDSCQFVTLGTGVGGDTSEDCAYDAMNRLLPANDDDSILPVTCHSLSRAIPDVLGSPPPK
ncbi:MAG: hypothetical protein K8T90_05380 [Planctomycetes bacterium]|nr:hypothetical protein [Planctomycetota bacterium]